MGEYESISTFSPEGTVKPLEYIRNTVELGNTTIALGNKKCGIIMAYTGKKSALSYKQPKIFKISETTLFSFAGITNDGFDIVKYLIDSSVWEEVYKDKKIHPINVFNDFSEDASLRTLYSRNRMYGCGGILMTIYKEEVKIVEVEPTGNVMYVKGVSVGERSQSAKTVLENYVDQFENASRNDLIKIGFNALKNAHTEEELTKENVDIWCLEEKAFFIDSFEF